MSTIINTLHTVAVVRSRSLLPNTQITVAKCVGRNKYNTIHILEIYECLLRSREYFTTAHRYKYRTHSIVEDIKLHGIRGFSSHTSLWSTDENKEEEFKIQIEVYMTAHPLFLSVIRPAVVEADILIIVTVHLMPPHYAANEEKQASATLTYFV